MIIIDIIKSVLNYILIKLLFVIQIFLDFRLLKLYLSYLLFILLLYTIIAIIYCWRFNLSYQKFFENTFFPIIGLVILIIQGIIYIFFIPYHIFFIIKDTFYYVIKVITKIYDYIYNFIYTILHIEDYLLYSI